MEKVVEFLTNNAVAIETGLSVIILILTRIGWKFRHAVIAAIQALKPDPDGKVRITEAEIDAIVSELKKVFFVKVA